jgi:hypothetical protein
MHLTDRATQQAEATEYFNFVTNPVSNLLELNSDDVIHTAIIGIPNLSLVKILYSGRLGSSGIGRTSPDDGKFLFLYGDGGPDIGAPSSMSLPTSIREIKKIVVMTDDQCSTKLTEKGANFQWPLLTRDKVTMEEEIMRIAPLPPYMFSKDCPFLLCVIQIINALKQFSRNAREAMSIMTKASILWVILLQARQFATGNMDVLAEFSALHANLVAKQANIYHAEVPAELFKQKSPLAQKRSGDDADLQKPTQEDHKNKRQH